MRREFSRKFFAKLTFSTCQNNLEIYVQELLTFVETNTIKIVTVLIILIAGLLFIKGTLKFTTSRLKKSKLDPTMHKFMLSVLKVTLYSLLIVILLQSVGVEMSSIIAVIGVAGLAISLAIQDTLTNVASGFMILASKPFEKGDYVNLNGNEGEVVHITIMHTKLNTIDNKAIFVPNKLVVSEPIINYSKEERRQLELIFSISYDDSYEQARELISNIVSSSSYALSEPSPPLIRMWEHSSSSIDIIVRVWVATENYFNLKFDLLEQVKAEFDSNGITIPYNHVTVIMSDK